MKISSLLVLFSFAAACPALAAAPVTSSRPPSSATSENIDSLGCGDGVKSAPNGWFVGIKRDDPNMFQETALLSVNLFNITGVSGDISFDNGAMGIVDASRIPKIVYTVTFQPGVDSIGYPTAHQDTINNRDKVLKELVSLGATVECNMIIKPRP